MNRSRKNNNTRLILTVAGVILVIVLIAILIINANRKKEDDNLGMTKDELDATDVIPYGDEEAEGYDYAGDYFDMATRKGSMTIEKDGSGYKVKISYAESEDTMTIWMMGASYDKTRRALKYSGATKTDYIFEGMDPDEVSTDSDKEQAGVTKTDGYKNGTGWIYLADENLFWIDDKEDMGSGMMYKKITEEEQEKAEEAQDKSEETEGETEE